MSHALINRNTDIVSIGKPFCNYIGEPIDSFSMTIGERVRIARKGAKLSQGQLADKIGMSQPSLSELERGLSSTTSFVAQIAEACSVNSYWLATGLGEMKDPFALPTIADDVTNEEYAFIPVMSVKAAAGSGYENFQEVNEGTLAFRRDWMVRSGLKEKNLRLIRATGESMEPTIYEGDMLLVDITAIEPHSGCIYALRRPDGSLSVKRLSQGFSGEWTIISDNRNKDKYRDEPIGNISTSNVPIAGRVVWRGGMM